MQTLNLDPAIPFVFDPGGALGLVIVGCGGTGSYLAQNAARLAHHCRQIGGPRVDIILVDGDTVEARNVGRQLFAPAEVGRNKAQTLAARLNHALGLKILAVPEMATPNLLAEIGNSGATTRILVGAVDSTAGRVAMQAALTPRSRYALWIDCGNHNHGGQVAVGNVTRKEQLAGCLSLGGICTMLPAPSLINPSLLVEPEAPVVAPGCAVDLEANRQSLMINQMMAMIASELLAKLVITRRITTFETTVDLGALSMRSQPITAAALAQACGLKAAQLTTAVKEKKGRAA